MSLVGKKQFQLCAYSPGAGGDLVAMENRPSDPLMATGSWPPPRLIKIYCKCVCPNLESAVGEKPCRADYKCALILTHLVKRSLLIFSFLIKGLLSVKARINLYSPFIGNCQLGSQRHWTFF